MVNEKPTSWLFSTLSRLLRHPSMRRVVRVGSATHVWLYRVTGGRAQIAQYPTMLLTTQGRKTGKWRTTPLIYVADGNRFIIAAAYSGSDKDPVWWLNLQHSKEGVVEVVRRKVQVRAEVAAPEDYERYWQQLCAMYPYFTEYQARTQRQIPIVILTPVGAM
jgi:F420H(2)-dependent quinone reductase